MADLDTVGVDVLFLYSVLQILWAETANAGYCVGVDSG